jgi:hypothetical protein
MQDRENTVVTKPRRVPWNKGKLIGAKPPLRPKHVWSIRTKLQVEGLGVKSSAEVLNDNLSGALRLAASCLRFPTNVRNRSTRVLRP